MCWHGDTIDTDIGCLMFQCSAMDVAVEDMLAKLEEFGSLMEMVMFTFIILILWSSWSKVPMMYFYFYWCGICYLWWSLCSRRTWPLNAGIIECLGCLCAKDRQFIHLICCVRTMAPILLLWLIPRLVYQSTRLSWFILNRSIFSSKLIELIQLLFPSELIGDWVNSFS